MQDPVASLDQSEQLAGTMFESAAPEPTREPANRQELVRGGTLSRYMLIERVGAGGMGVVRSTDTAKRRARG